MNTVPYYFTRIFVNRQVLLPKLHNFRRISTRLSHFYSKTRHPKQDDGIFFIKYTDIHSADTLFTNSAYKIKRAR